DISNIPVLDADGKPILLRNIAGVSEGTTVSQYERSDSMRVIRVRANIAGSDLDGVARQVERALDEFDELRSPMPALCLGSPPKPGVNCRKVSGQVDTMRETLDYLQRGLALAIVAIFLM